MSFSISWGVKCMASPFSEPGMLAENIGEEVEFFEQKFGSAFGADCGNADDYAVGERAGADEEIRAARDRCLGDFAQDALREGPHAFACKDQHREAIKVARAKRRIDQAVFSVKVKHIGEYAL